ncbi:MAG TPA: alpha/beta fold hydrolase [Propionibacteriaceae bacterium]|nr:alpha/beta fold hydrolase [Propionibacteriaceae bacterium]
MLGVVSWLTPALAARVAARLWFTIPPRVRVGVDVAGGAPFETSVDGRVVRGAVWGDGPVVYLVHGWAGDRRQMAPLVEPLVAAGYRVVAFDGPSHGRSDPGRSGPGRSHAVEFANALATVASRHGAARAVVAHSMGAMATMVALRLGRLSAERLVFVAPMHELRSYLDRFADSLGLGRRARRRLDADLEAHVGMLVEDFELLNLAEDTQPAPLLVVHDRNDRQLGWAESVALVDQWPGARLVTTEGLGHSRLLGDSAVHEAIVDFVSR